jgi:hypothetical protein
MAIAQFFNQYSFFMLPATILVVAAAVLMWRRAKPIVWAVWGLALVGVFAFALINRVSQTATVKLDTAADIRAAIQVSGRPTLVEFYSNY